MPAMPTSPSPRVSWACSTAWRAAGAAAHVRSGGLLGWPVVLVLDVKGQIETAAAVALGCASFRDDVGIAGVILNRVASRGISR
jgi:cobyrinic acid a,c-diamide synthase